MISFLARSAGALFVSGWFVSRLFTFVLFTAVAANLLFNKFMFEATLREPLREPTFKQTTLEALTSTRGNYEIRKHVKISWS